MRNINAWPIPCCSVWLFCVYVFIQNANPVVILGDDNSGIVKLQRQGIILTKNAIDAVAFSVVKRFGLPWDSACNKITLVSRAQENLCVV